MLNRRDSWRPPKGLKSGADDTWSSLCPVELYARMEAILRRSRAAQNIRLQVADLSYDLDTLQVPSGAKHSTHRSSEATEVLIARSPAVVRRPVLKEPCGEELMRSHVHQLRQCRQPFAALLHTCMQWALCLPTQQ